MQNHKIYPLFFAANLLHCRNGSNAKATEASKVKKELYPIKGVMVLEKENQTQNNKYKQPKI